MKSDDVVLLFKHYNERSSSPTTSQLRHICRLQLTWTNMNPLQGRAFSITPSKVGQFSKFFLTSWLTHLYCTVSVTHRALPKGQRSGKFDDVSCCTAAACCLHRCLYHTRCWSGLFTTDNWSLSRAACSSWSYPRDLNAGDIYEVLWLDSFGFSFTRPLKLKFVQVWTHLYKLAYLWTLAMMLTWRQPGIKRWSVT